jgi:hypothetical protein
VDALGRYPAQRLNNANMFPATGPGGRQTVQQDL